MSRANQPFSSVKTEGGLLPQDMLARIQGGDPELKGTKAETYHLGPHGRIGEAANQAWSRLVASWRTFQEVLAKEPEDALATGLTRDRWLLPLFEILGYGRLPKGTAFEIEGKNYAVSHTWHHSPIHLLGCRVDLDTRQKGVAGAAKSSPHGLVQEFLNRSGAHLWGFVSNGYQLRVLRDHHSLTRQAYVEFDLQAIMDGEQYSEFLLLWLICHQSRVESEKPEECWLESWMNISRDEGVSALDKLRDGVEKAIEAFGTGFLAHKANVRLKAALESGELDSQEYYRQILRLVYRLIFLFVAEERDVLLDPDATEDARERYRRYYATRRIRGLADKRRGGPHGDLWRGIALVMEKLDDGCPALGLSALGSRLWGPGACPWLMDAECANKHVLTAIYHLSNIQEGKTRYPVNWRNVGADELGSIYEGLLELHPRMNKEAATFELDTAPGHERKTTGSYYTPTSLVDCLLDSALEPVLDEACKKHDPDEVILDLKVCDPACGSGHFLVAAARRIAMRLASIRSGDDEPSPRDVQEALRDVVSRSIYGVDLNPMAVELCKVSLWMEAIEPGKPLSFLDSHIQCGNALLGATPALMSRGIPDDAFKPIEGDDKDAAKRLKRRNRDERRGQTTLFGLFAAESAADYKAVATQAAGVEKATDDSIAAVREKERRWDILSHSPEFKDAWFRADAWCSSFVWPKQPGDLENAAITYDTWRQIEKDVSASSQMTRSTVRKLAQRYRFLHWHLAFPQVFGEPRDKPEEGDNTGWADGFDVVLGNPPWEMVETSEKEYFAESHPHIAGAKTARDRTHLIQELEREDPVHYRRFLERKRFVAGTRQFIQNSSRMPHSAVGRINSYPLFVETAAQICSENVGIIVPSAIAMDAYNAKLFRWLCESRRLRSLFDFENRDGIFPQVHRSYRFCLLTISATSSDAEIELCFFAHSVATLSDLARRVQLKTSDLLAFSPNTLAPPMLINARDGRLATAVYQQNGVLIDRRELLSTEGAGVSISRMLSLSDNGDIFRHNEELQGPDKMRGSSDWERLYTGKAIHQYDHRYSTWDNGSWLVSSIEMSMAPDFEISTEYYARAGEVTKRIAEKSPDQWLVGYRDVCRATDERTAIAAVIPRVGCDTHCRNIYFRSAATEEIAFFVANFNSFVLDYFCRQKVVSIGLGAGIVEQLPFLPRSTSSREALLGRGTARAWVALRVLELTYTSWGLEPFADDCGYSGPPFRWNAPRRAHLRCELDAAFFCLYGLERDDVEYIMESFPIVKRRDERAHGDYRTKLQILGIYDAMQRAIDTGESYQSILDPTPADPRVAHSESTRPDWAKRKQ